MKKKYTLEDLENILDSIPYGVSLQDEDDRYIYINKSFSNEFNLKKEDIINNHPADLFGIEEWSRIKNALKKSSKSKYGIFSEFCSSINNKWYDLYCSQFGSNNKTLTASITSELSLNMTRVYNSFYFTRERDSMDFLGYADMIYNSHNNNFLPSEEFKKE